MERSTPPFQGGWEHITNDTNFLDHIRQNISWDDVGRKKLIQPQFSTPKHVYSPPNCGRGEQGWDRSMAVKSSPYFVNHIDATTQWEDPRVIQKSTVSEKNSFFNENSNSTVRSSVIVSRTYESFNPSETLPTATMQSVKSPNLEQMNLPLQIKLCFNCDSSEHNLKTCPHPRYCKKCQQHGHTANVCRSVALDTTPQRNSNTASLYVGHLSSSTTEETLLQLFGQYGTVERIDLKTGFGFVTMNANGVQAAVAALHGYNLDGFNIKVANSVTNEQRTHYNKDDSFGSATFAQAYKTKPCRYKDLCKDPNCTFAHSWDPPLKPQSEMHHQIGNKECRYGNFCHNANCLFKHPEQEKTKTVISN